ncbi:MAG: glycosyltransferase family 39 protein [Elusimicrobiota bacterium]|nr:glycosyltransferase family 39 protein [Elusimicrobiota bacterium]
MNAAAAERRASWSIFVTALAVRAVFAWRKGLPPLVADAAEYRFYAASLVETGSYLGPQGEFAARMPGYPLFLAAVRALFGDSLIAVIAAQCLLGAATCLLLYKLAKRILPGPWPLAGGVLSAVYFGLVEPVSLVLSESLYSFFLVLSAWALFHPLWRPAVRAAAFGVLAGFLYLVRPEPLPYILATIALMPILWPNFGRKEIAAALAGLALVTGVWIGRNFAHFDRFLPASTAGKSVVYISLYLPAARHGLAPEGRWFAPAGMGELESEEQFAERFRELAARMTWRQLASAYLFNFASILYPFLPGYDWTYMLVLPFALIGLASAVKHKELRPAAMSVVFSVTIFTFCGGWASRYRQGVAPFIILLGAAGMMAVDKWAGRARFLAGASAWLAFNLLIWAGQAQVRQLVLWLRALAWGH